MTFTPCSRKHKSCSPFHADMVREYQRERERQETALEELINTGHGEREHWKAFGGKMITFRDWLSGHRIN